MGHRIGGVEKVGGDSRAGSPKMSNESMESKKDQRYTVTADGYACGDHSVMYRELGSLSCTPETKVALCVSCTQIRKLKNKTNRTTTAAKEKGQKEQLERRCRGGKPLACSGRQTGQGGRKWQEMG